MSGALCLDCGLCCDGTLFDHYKLEPSEMEFSRKHKLRVYNPESDRAIVQPCPCFSGVCDAYEDRPSTCRSFRCDLLVRCEAGLISLEDAKEVVRAIRRRAEALREKLDASPGARLWMQVEDVRTLARETADESVLLALLEAGALRRALVRDVYAKLVVAELAAREPPK